MIKLEIQEIYDKNITQLDLSKRQLRVLPPKICTFKKLKLLNLSTNLLKILPHKIYKLTNLIGLILLNNLLKYILAIKVFKQLINLEITNNKLKFLPLLPEIKYLSIDNNQILFIYVNRKNIKMNVRPSMGVAIYIKLLIFNNYDIIFNDDI